MSENSEAGYAILIKVMFGKKFPLVELDFDIEHLRYTYRMSAPDGRRVNIYLTSESLSDSNIKDTINSINVWKGRN